MLDSVVESVLSRAMELSSYSPFVPRSRLRALHEAGRSIAGLRVLHVSGCAEDTPTSHLLRWLVPASRALGVDCEWRRLRSFADARCARAVADALVTRDDPLPDAVWRTQISLNLRVAAATGEGWDVIVVHDPVLALLATIIPDAAGTWLWRPGHASVGRLARHARHYSCLVTDADTPELGVPARTIPLGIDPLAPTSTQLTSECIEALCLSVGVDPSRPMVLHSGQFSGLAGAGAVVDAYWAIKQDVPELQMVALGSRWTAVSERPEPESLLARVDEDPDVHVITAVNSWQVNALRSHASVVVHANASRASGIDVAESLWKRRPVLTAARPASPGTLFAPNRDALATHIGSLLADRRRASRLGMVGHELVRRHLLAPTVLEAWLETLGAAAHRTLASPIDDQVVLWS